MNNGQIVSIPSVATEAQLVTKNPAPASTTESAQKNGEDFAGILSGIQHIAKEPDSAAASPARELLVAIDTEPLPADTNPDNPTGDLLAQLQIAEQTLPKPQPVELKLDDLEKKMLRTEDTPFQNAEQPDITSQIMVMLAANSPFGRMPEVNKSTPLPVDRAQNADSVMEHIAIISTFATQKTAENTQQLVSSDAVKTVPAVTPQLIKSDITLDINKQLALQADSQQLQSPLVVETLPTTTAQPVKSGKMLDVDKLTAFQTDNHQNLDYALKQGPVVSDSSGEKLGSNSQQLQSPIIVETLPTTTAQPVKSDKILDVDKLTALQIDKQYNVAKGTEQTARFAAFPEKIQVEHQLAGPMPAVADKTVKIIPETNVTATMPVKQAVPQITGTAGPNVPLQSEKQANVPISPASVTSKELDIDLQLSQPQPVTARVTVAAATGSNRSAAPVHESGDTGRQYSSEQQIERVRTATDRRDVKEMASSLQSITADSESMSGTGTSLEGETNQGQADVDSGDQMLTQNLRLSTDHQKVSPVTARSISNEPAVPDTTEQVLQQVKERLMKHDVKPGNQQITLTLSPDSLGELKMNLNLQGQKLSVEIVTENKTVRDAIVHHTEALRESLARQNITMESFDVTTGGKGSGGQGQNQSAWREMVKQQQQQQFWSSSRNYQTSQANLEPGLATYQKQQGESMLDIHY